MVSVNLQLPRVSQAAPKQMRDDLPGSFTLEPGAIDRAILDAAYKWAKKQKKDKQYENLEGMTGHPVPLAELKAQRPTGSDGYYRPERIHTSLAHGDDCKLSYYGRAWAQSGKEKEKKVYEMRHMPKELLDLLIEVKSKFYHVLNKESREAIYDLCVVTFYGLGEGIDCHSDTIVDWLGQQVANIDGAAVLSVCVGNPCELWTRKRKSALPTRKPKRVKKHKYAKEQLLAADLVDGSAFCWDAGHEHSDDYNVQHRVCQHSQGLLETDPLGERVAFVFRAMKPELARRYSVNHPHKMR